MAKLNKKRDTGCPVAFALDSIGDRWSLLIIRDMVAKGYRTYGEFLDSEEAIATNVLADRLRELEADGVIASSRDPDNHRKINYTLTNKGCDLVPVIMEMVRWSAKYDPNTTAKKKILKRIETDRDEFFQELTAQFR